MKNDIIQAMSIVANEVISSRQNLLNLMSGGKDIEKECGYPVEISKEQYLLNYRRYGIARRIISIWPELCWESFPTVYEQEDAQETEFENKWNEIQKKAKLFYNCNQADILSGIGYFGILFLGFNDNKPLYEPVEISVNLDLIYVRPFQDYYVTVKKTIEDATDPLYGMPEIYTINFTESKSGTVEQTTTDVHYTRVIHIAEGKEESRYLGTPRLQPVFNYNFDLKKIASGSGEMFWKGAYPGYSIETNENIDENTEINTDEIAEELEKYMNGLKRFMQMQGLNVKSLAPQVADPTAHADTQLKLISASIGIPYRMFIGAEQAHLASSQDSINLSKKIKKRQIGFVNSEILEPLIDKLIEYKVLPEPKQYQIEWPDIFVTSEKEKTEIAKLKTETLKIYADSLNSVNIISPDKFFNHIMEYDQDVIDDINSEAKGFVEGSDL